MRWRVTDPPAGTLGVSERHPGVSGNTKVAGAHQARRPLLAVIRLFDYPVFRLFDVEPGIVGQAGEEFERYRVFAIDFR